MAEYRLRIEAMQRTKDNAKEILQWCSYCNMQNGSVHFGTLGLTVVQSDSWIVKMQGQFYLYSDKEFKEYFSLYP